MKFAAREDIDAPIAEVFAGLTDFDRWQREAMRRGAVVNRTDVLPVPARGMGWTADFTYRGRPRRLNLLVDEIAAPSRLAVSGSGPNVAGTLMVDLTEMSPRRTRMIVRLEVRPRTLAARLFLQSLKLARGKVDAKFADRVRQFAARFPARGS
jgi:carbon monoxide dehydrogenase subunit G